MEEQKNSIRSEKLKEDYEALKTQLGNPPHSHIGGVCPICGYCPYCGRGGNHWNYPHYPPYQPPITWC